MLYFSYVVSVIQAVLFFLINRCVSSVLNQVIYSYSILYVNEAYIFDTEGKCREVGGECRKYVEG